MLQTYVARYQLISSHPTSCISYCCLLETGWPRPLPTGLLNLSYFPLRYLIWSSFQYLISTYILVSYFSIHAIMLLLLEINFLHLILPVALLLFGVGWPPPLPRTHPFHRGEWGWWVMTMTMAGGVGGPGTWNIYMRVWHMIYSHVIHLVMHEQEWFLRKVSHMNMVKVR